MTPGLLLLHGFTGSPASWNPAIAGLETRGRILVPPLVGHGNATTCDVVDFDGELERLAALAAGAPRWHLAGYSLGGRIAIGMLCTRPELFASATLIGAQPGLESDADRTERRAADERWCAMLLERGLSEFVSAWESQPLFASQRGLSDEARLRQRAERLGASAEGLVRSLRTTGLGAMPSYWDRLSAIRVPVTLVAGSLDQKFRAIAERMATRIPDARLEIVHGAGHNVLFERPDEIARLLEQAVDRGDPS